MNRVVVSGLGIVSPVGTTPSAYWDSLRSGCDRLTAPSALPDSELRVAEIKDADFLDGFPVSAHACDRSAQFAVAAAAMAVKDAGFEGPFAQPDRIAVVLGNGAGGQTSIDAQYIRIYGQGLRRVHPMTVAKAMGSSSASWVSIALGARGPCFVTSSACASSNHAIGIAAQLVRTGMVDVAITGGTEACLSLGTLVAWQSMRILASKACRPFARGRDGLILAEGAGILVLESEAHAMRRGHSTGIELAGFGCNADAGDMLAPDPAGMAAVMRLALADARLAASDVAYVNAHGTATALNDKTETDALKRVFGGAATCPPVSSTKAVTGHALGAAGAFEAVATVLAMKNDMAPPTANYDDADPDCDLDFIPNVARAMRIPVALSNSFAFGGINASLVFKQANLPA